MLINIQSISVDRIGAISALIEIGVLSALINTNSIRDDKYPRYINTNRHPKRINVDKYSRYINTNRHPKRINVDKYPRHIRMNRIESYQQE